jgi:hypothetical protein
MNRWLGRTFGSLGAVCGILLLGAGTAAAPGSTPPNRSTSTPVPAGLTVLPAPQSDSSGPTDVVIPPLKALGPGRR